MSKDKTLLMTERKTPTHYSGTIQWGITGQGQRNIGPPYDLPDQGPCIPAEEHQDSDV